MSDDVPDLRPLEEWQPIRDQAGLEHLWRALMGPLGFSAPSLWWTFFKADGRASGFITKMDEIPDVPEPPRVLDNLMWLCAELLVGDLAGGSVAFLYTRPGRAGLTPEDLAWGRTLLEAARRNGVRCEPVHAANDEALRVLSPDDLAGPGRLSA